MSQYAAQITVTPEMLQKRASCRHAENQDLDLYRYQCKACGLMGYNGAGAKAFYETPGNEGKVYDWYIDPRGGITTCAQRTS